MSSKRTGCQEPRIRLEPPRSYSDGQDACELVEDYGITLDPWQRLVLDAWLGRDELDQFTSTTNGLSVPRQNGKNEVIKVREFYGLVAIGETILHSAHEVRTANEAFMRLCSLFEDTESFPELAELVLKVSHTNGKEGIYLKNGGSIRFSARTKGTARGMSLDCVVFDEAQFMDDTQLEAMMSTMAAAPLGNRQLIFTGTPPNQFNSGEVFSRIRKMGLRKEASTTWHEWSVPEIGDVKDKERWYRTNPALGFRLSEEFTETECNSMSEDGFARERLGWWASESANSLISDAEWSRLAVESSPEPDECKLAYGVRFSSDGGSVALSVALKPDVGRPYVELIEYKSMREGTAWLASWLAERKSKASVIVIDGRSHTDSLVAQLREKGVSRAAIMVPRSTDVIACSSRFLNAVREGDISHIASPSLDDNVCNARKRNIGQNGGWGFAGVGDRDVSPLESAVLAYWGVMTTKRNPRRKSRML